MLMYIMVMVMPIAARCACNNMLAWGRYYYI